MQISPEEFSSYIDTGKSDSLPIINTLTECNLTSMRIAGRALIGLLSDRSIQTMSEDHVIDITEQIPKTFSFMSEPEQRYLILAISLAYYWGLDGPYPSFASNNLASSDFMELCLAMVEKGD